MTTKLSQTGFTLIEVLVGMVIIAITLATVNRAAGQAIQTSEELKLRVLADLVAQNRLEIHRAQRDWLAPGKFSGKDTQAGKSLIWKEVVTETPNPAFRKIVVEVFNAENPNHQLRRLVGFLTLEPPKK